MTQQQGGVMPDRDPLTGVPASRHPFQFWALAASMFAGLSTVLQIGEPGTLVALLPKHTVIAWGATVMVGGALGVVASWWKDRITGLLLERIALAGIGGGTFIYGGVLIYVASSAATTAALYCLATAIASAWRIRHVNRELGVLTRWIERAFE